MVLLIKLGDFFFIIISSAKEKHTIIQLTQPKQNLIQFAAWPQLTTQLSIPIWLPIPKRYPIPQWKATKSRQGT